MAFVDQRIFIRKNVPGPTSWHERFVICYYEGDTYAVLNPDEYVYLEDLVADGEDVRHVRPRGRRGGVPVLWLPSPTLSQCMG